MSEDTNDIFTALMEKANVATVCAMDRMDTCDDVTVVALRLTCHCITDGGHMDVPCCAKHQIMEAQRLTAQVRAWQLLTTMIGFDSSDPIINCGLCHCAAPMSSMLKWVELPS